MTPEARKGEQNAIWLCNNCGRLVDNDTNVYTVEVLAKWKRDAIDRARAAQASGGRSPTVDALVNEQRRTKFTENYTLFLQEANAYAAEIAAYCARMRVTAYRLGRSDRLVRQQQIADACAAMHRSLQPILLDDDDNSRAMLRWELLRRRGLEPLVDTVENQEAYAVMIHYHHLRLLDGIARLQSNVRAALGLSVREQTKTLQAFEEQMFQQAKNDAAVVKARIKAQYDDLVRSHSGAATSAPARASALVSDRPSDTVRNRVWNVLHTEIYEEDADDDWEQRRGGITLAFVREIWRDILVQPIDEVPMDFVAAWQRLRGLFMTCADPTFYAIVALAGRVEDIREKLDEALAKSDAAYRFKQDKLEPIAPCVSVVAAST